MNPHQKILFLVPYPKGTAASQRFRFEQYLGKLTNSGYEWEYHSFLSPEAWKILYKPGHISQKVIQIFWGLMRRYVLLFRVSKFDFVFIHRETAPLGPPIFEWMVANLLKRKIIYDFDDAIWIPNVSQSNRVFGFLKRFRNTETLCRLAYKISCGNPYLCSYAQQYNPNVVLNPTTIDTEKLHTLNYRIIKAPDIKPIIGWTGTHSTIQYLYDLLPILRKLENEFDFEFRVISDQKPDFELKSLNYIPWNSDTEIRDLSALDIGLMPLKNDQWSEGKCGFKALQYMALGIPALVSPVGVNTQIVDDGINGFVCADSEQWEAVIRKLLAKPSIVVKMSLNTRSKIENHYSVNSNTQNFLSLFS